MHERWLVLSARAPADDPLRDLVAQALLALGGLSVLDEGDHLTTYLSSVADPESELARAGHFLADWLEVPEPPALTWSWAPHADWEREWRRGLRPRQVTPRLVVKPSWSAWDATPGQIVLEIDPQMAFGTGEHATTRACLRLLDMAVRPGDRVLDVGSGSAILAIAAARLGAGEVMGVECEADSNLNARENIARNGVEDRVRIREARADTALLGGLGRFDLILANVLSSVIRPLLPAFHAALEPGGRLIVSGVLISERQEVLADAHRTGLRLEREDQEEEWWSALLVALPAEPDRS